MTDTWKATLKRLQELQKTLPEPVLIELTYIDGHREALTLQELQKKDNTEYKSLRLLKGNNTEELSAVLDWIAPDTVID